MYAIRSYYGAYADIGGNGLDRGYAGYGLKDQLPAVCAAAADKRILCFGARAAFVEFLQRHHESVQSHFSSYYTVV